MMDVDGLTYRRSTGDGGRLVLTRLYQLSDLDLKALYAEHTYNLRDVLGLMLIDPYEADEIEFCGECDDVHPNNDELRWVDSAGLVCDPCIERSYTWCDDCEEYRPDGTTRNINDRQVCDGCRENYYYCQECQEYYGEYDDADHDHEDDRMDCCTSPELTFTFGGLPNDEQQSVSIPAGHISDEGIGEIARYLRGIATPTLEPSSGDAPSVGYHPTFQASYELGGLGREWQTKAGNFTKRLSKHLYKNYDKFKLDSEHLAHIGGVARNHSKGSEIEIDVTRDLDQAPDAFCHDSSCWWTDYAHSRCTLKSNGGFGLRSFGGRYCEGRAWVMPLKLTDAGDLVPTFRTDSAAAYLVFNGYGELEGYTAPRIVAAMTGLSYRKVSIGGNTEMYVNRDTGYLVSTEDVLSDNTTVYLNLSQHSNLHESEMANCH